MRLIDADALKEYIDMQKGRPFIGCTIGEALKMMTDEQPTIEERKTGRWIDDGSELGCACSECGVSLDEYISNLNEYNHLIKYPRLCPNCGCKMEVEYDT